MTQATVFIGVLLFVMGVVGWGYMWSAIGEWVDNKTYSTALCTIVMFAGSFGLPIATMCAMIAGSRP